MCLGSSSGKCNFFNSCFSKLLILFFLFLMFVMNVMHERKVLIGLTHHSHNDFLTTLHGLTDPASTDVKNTGGNRSTISPADPSSSSPDIFS